MEAITRIPKILETVEQMRQSYDLQKVFASYKQNVKIFIEAMKDQVLQLMNQYQNIIKALQLEIATIKSITPSSQFVRTPQQSKYYPTPQKTKIQSLVQTTNSANSTNFTPFKSVKLQNLPISSIYRKKSFDESHFPEQFMNQQSQIWQKSQSKFEQANKRKKQRQQQLRLYLQSGKRNMNTTTELFLEAVGKNKDKDTSFKLDQIGKIQEGSFDNKKEESLNKSLGQICEALDTSFVSKRARSDKKKKMASIQKQIKEKQQIQYQTAKLLKDRGIKSLLQRLRNNVEISPHKTPQKITSSKLISTGQKSKDNDGDLSPGRKSKVMINPVPVDIVSRSKVINRSRDNCSSPEIKPQSILKRGSTILSSHDLTL